MNAAWALRLLGLPGRAGHLGAARIVPPFTPPFLSSRSRPCRCLGTPCWVSRGSTAAGCHHKHLAASAFFCTVCRFLRYRPRRPPPACPGQPGMPLLAPTAGNHDYCDSAPDCDRGSPRCKYSPLHQVGLEEERRIGGLPCQFGHFAGLQSSADIWLGQERMDSLGSSTSSAGLPPQRLPPFLSDEPGAGQAGGTAAVAPAAQLHQDIRWRQVRPCCCSLVLRTSARLLDFLVRPC